MTSRDGLTNHDRSSEAGQVSVLIIGLMIVLAMTVAVVVDASAAYLHRQRLDTLADGAALYAADAAATGRETYLHGVEGERLDLALLPKVNDGVANARVRHGLDPAVQVADLPRAQHVARLLAAGAQRAHRKHVASTPGPRELELVALLDLGAP